jgi:hypothetical protein
MVDIDRWMDEHDAELMALAEQLGTHDDTVRYVASLVLAGERDPEIYERLRDVSPTFDGQRNPLAGAADVVFEVRRMVATS